ncbi:DUF805 domain-containing protein [Nitrogeniibacter mangrovi]|uniref:DUF805 domain-containing protein n=1 Tax=Nitrogeniibacter mangrovi TaxID=2016596 RepID=A0A6C1B4S6_9RHOO|nr:DUF805 domain-containing protein [Nitrogeniibacter mangrovi]QID18009.1 DUF805 domain-containing protein [Nitrogeniibacter mangrovi]
MDHYQLVFSGDILPGHDTEAVRQRLAALLKVSPDRHEQLFSGRAVVIKRRLDADTAQAYRRKLAAMGVGIRVEPETAPAAPKPTPVTHPAPPAQANTASGDAPLARETPIEEMDCPECGRRQPRRNLCINCGVDMPRMIAAREQAETEARQPGGEQAAASIRVRPYEPLATETSERPPLVGLGFSGRLSRRSYFTGVCLYGSLFLLVMLAVAISGSKLLFALAVLLSVVASLRLGVLRSHDFNWSGWWTLLSFVPLVGGVYALLLLFFPGSKDENDFGAPPEPNRWTHAFGALALLVLTPVLVAMIAPAQLARGMTVLGQAGGAYPRSAPTQAVPAMDLRGYDPALNDVVMYSLTTCGYCRQKREQFDALGVRYVEVFIDTDEGARRALDLKLQSSGHHGGAIGTPIIEVNGTLLLNNPSLDAVADHLIRRRS